MIKYTIKNKMGYENLKARVDKGAVYLEGKWFDPQYARLVNHYNAMACALLDWEMATGIFDIEFAKFEREMAQRNVRRRVL